jgi:hypothetical protein
MMALAKVVAGPREQRQAGCKQGKKKELGQAARKNLGKGKREKMGRQETWPEKLIEFGKCFSKSLI